MSIQLLALVGLVIGVSLYALLVRRRAEMRGLGSSVARQLAQSNEVALRRIRDATKRSASLVAGGSSAEGIAVDGRSGVDRRAPEDRRRGRGRRFGGDRRRADP